MCLEWIHAKCVVCFSFIRRWHQRDCGASLSVLNLLGLALKLCCLVTFSTWSDRKKHSCIFLVIYCIVYFSLLNLCPRGERGFAPTLDPLQSFGREGLASHCFCFGSCCNDNTGSAGSQGLSADIQSLFRGQNPSSSGKGHETF